MAFTVEQTINGTTYVYRSVSYWDKEKKQSRHRRVCIGKKDTKTGRLIPGKSQQPARACRDFGNYHLLNDITCRLGLDVLLKELFPETWREILTCSYYEISERKPLYLCEPWSESTQTPKGSVLSSQRISDLLQELGKDDRGRLAFFQSWARHRAEREFLAYDITSISSYSKLIEYLEYGHNRDGEDLPQINLGMLFGEKSLLPIYYNTTQGSIHDLSSLTNMIEHAEFLNIRKIRFVMDKGFYSDANVREMLKKQVHFTIALPFTTSLAKSLVDKHRAEIAAPTNSFLINGDFRYSTNDHARFGRDKINAFIYFDERRLLDAKENLMKRILALEAKLDGKNRIPLGIKDPHMRYLIIRRSKNGLHIKRNEEVIAEHLTYKGYMVILSNRIRVARDALHVYRAKNVVERAFENMKNELDMNRLRVHSEISMTGRTFVCFISLILQSWLDKRMKETNLYKRYTQEEVMVEMKRMKIIELGTEKTLHTEISKNQKYLLKTLGIPIPTKT